MAMADHFYFIYYILNDTKTSIVLISELILMKSYIVITIVKQNPDLDSISMAIVYIFYSKFSRTGHMSCEIMVGQAISCHEFIQKSEKWSDRLSLVFYK